MSQCTGERLPAQTVETAMEQHHGLIHAFIQCQGGGDISYEEALQARAVMIQGQVIDLDMDLALSAAKVSAERKPPVAESVMLATTQPMVRLSGHRTRILSNSQACRM